MESYREKIDMTTSDIGETSPWPWQILPEPTTMEERRGHEPSGGQGSLTVAERQRRQRTRGDDYPSPEIKIACQAPWNADTDNGVSMQSPWSPIRS